MNTNIKEFKTKGYVTLEYPKDLRKSVNKTIASWKLFCDLPIDVKKGLPYSNNADGVGYEFKEGIGNKADRKENFDVTTVGQEWLKKNSRSIDNPIVLDFIKDSTSLVGLMKPLILDFARQCEEEYGLVGFADEVDQSEENFFVRFIHYFGDRQINEETAVSHCDQSGFTLHLFESDPGLQCLNFNMKWEDMPVSEGETVIIPAMQMQLRSSGELKALCHRVVANINTAEYGRYSAVCFVQLKNTNKYNKDKFGRLQEKAPGFNYNMDIKEFAKMFK